MLVEAVFDPCLELGYVKHAISGGLDRGLAPVKGLGACSDVPVPDRSLNKEKGGIRKTSKKSKEATAFLITLLILAFITPFFWFNIHNASPLGKTIKKCFVYPDGTPIGEGLTVDLYDGSLIAIDTKETDADGCVTFTGVETGTYTIKYSWQGVPKEECLGMIDCSKQLWEFTNTVPYWEVGKYFTYEDGTPIVGLDVDITVAYATAGEPICPLTDVNGYVSVYVKAGASVTFSWYWQGVPDRHLIYVDGFQTLSPQTATNELDYWTACKYFTYPDGTPIVGLSVTPDKNGAAMSPTVTDAEGKVCVEGLKAGDFASFKWSWQGAVGTHIITIPLDFQTPTPVTEPNELPYWTICKKFTYADGTPIVALDVTLDGMTDRTDDTGTVCFDVKAGDYTLGYSWQGSDYTHDISIGFDTASPVIIETNVLSYWTVEKTFYYAETTDPVVGLTVTFDGKTGTTDENGFVSFADVKAGDYTLEWMWNGASVSEPVSIGFADATPYVIDTNYLEPKSGGG